MRRGKLLGIYIAPRKTAALESLDEAELVLGKGLEGDRYFKKAGTFSFANPKGPGREITLIEEEALTAAERDYGIKLAPAESRRNLITRGVALNHLVGRRFRVGGVELRGVRLCEPCGHLEKLTRPGVAKAFVHRGGLRVEIIRGGALRVGDPIRAAASA